MKCGHPLLRENQPVPDRQHPPVWPSMNMARDSMEEAMSDDTTNRGARDRARINVNQD